jgi:hypothetical protein
MDRYLGYFHLGAAVHVFVPVLVDISSFILGEGPPMLRLSKDRRTLCRYCCTSSMSSVQEFQSWHPP